MSKWGVQNALFYSWWFCYYNLRYVTIDNMMLLFGCLRNKISSRTIHHKIKWPENNLLLNKMIKNDSALLSEHVPNSWWLVAHCVKWRIRCLLYLLYISCRLWKAKTINPPQSYPIKQCANRICRPHHHLVSTQLFLLRYARRLKQTDWTDHLYKRFDFIV